MINTIMETIRSAEAAGYKTAYALTLKSICEFQKLQKEGDNKNLDIFDYVNTRLSDGYNKYTETK